MTIEPILDPKTQLLVALGAAVAAKCQHCFATLYHLADQVGADDGEVRAVVAIATKVSGKSQDFMAAFIEGETRGTVAAPATSGGGCPCG